MRQSTDINLTLAICVYNKEEYIGDTLQTVVGQSFQDFHLLIVDDHSTDRSVEKIRSILDTVERPYELVVLKENRGIGYARHFAERHATTKYMMFLDSDDLLYPDAIKRMYGKITSDSDLMAVGCYLEYIDEKGKKIGGGLFLGEKDKDSFFEKAAAKKLIFMQPTAIYDRALALSVGGYVIDGYPEGKPRYQDYCEDLDLWTRMSDLYTEGKAIIVLPEILCQYRKAGGLSSSTYYMILKMRYVKENLLRRRAGEEEQSFTAFLNGLSPQVKSSLQRDAAAADSLRNGVMLIRNHHFGKGIWKVIQSIWYRPGYIAEKIRHNLLRK